MYGLEFLSLICRETARLSLERHCQNLPVVATDLDENRLNVAPGVSSASRIFIASPAIKIIFRNHFDIEAASRLASIGLDRGINEIDLSLASDFMRELSNLHAGFFRGLLEKAGLSAGFSLPVVASGTLQSAFEAAKKKENDFVAWSLEHPQATVYGSAEIEMIDTQKYLEIAPELDRVLRREVDSEEEDRGGVEFFLDEPSAVSDQHTIAIIDDSQSIRDSLRLVLNKAGYNVVEAVNGLEGLELLTSGKKIDFILLDNNMPGLDGIAMLEQLQKKSENFKTPVFMLTTETSESLKISGRDFGVTAWITKPFITAKLLEGLKKVLSNPDSTT